MFVKTLSAAFCLMAFASGTALAEPENAQVPMAMLFAKYDKYLEMAAKEQPAFRPRYQAFSKSEDAGEIHFTFDHNGEARSFTADRKGFIDFRPDAALLKANPIITINRPKGTMGINLTIGVIETGRTAYEIKALHQKVHQAWGQAKSLGGMMSMFAPKHSNVTAVFDETCPNPTWSVKAGGETVAGGASEKRATIEFKEKKIRKADSVSFSCAPAYFVL